jgi:hypothetical protein
LGWGERTVVVAESAGMERPKYVYTALSSRASEVDQ